MGDNSFELMIRYPVTRQVNVLRELTGATIMCACVLSNTRVARRIPFAARPPDGDASDLSISTNCRGAWLWIPTMPSGVRWVTLGPAGT